MLPLNKKKVKDSSVEKGKEGEEEAVRFLKKLGYKIIDRNYKTKFGEIDIIALDSSTLVFIEVKKRKSLAFGKPEEAVDIKKQKKILKVAISYLKEKKIRDKDLRFDIIGITNDKPELIKSAFLLTKDFYTI